MIAVVATFAAALFAFPYTPAAAAPTLQPTVRPAASPVALTPAGSDSLDRFRAQRLEWEPCASGSEAECAKYEVPLDYANPNGRTISIGVARHRATGASIGSIVVNPGGPGGSATDLVINSIAALPPQLRSSFDIIGPDPRGVGRSTRLMCMTQRQYEQAPGSLPASRDQRRAFMAVLRDLPDGCETLSPGLISHVGTHNVARDMDILRSILREPKLNYLGISYGTYVGAIYASLFPRNVGRFVLDSNMNPSQGLAGLARSQARGFQIAFNRFTAACAASGECPFPGSPQQVSAAFTSRLNALNATPLPVPGEAPVRYTEAMEVVQGGLTGGAAAWPIVFIAASALAAGDGPTLRQISTLLKQGTNPINLASVNAAVNCFERPGIGGAPAALARASEWSRFSPTFGRAMAWSSVGCSGWPVRAPQGPGDFTVSGAPAMLLIGGRFDPNTPLVETYAMQRKLPGSRVLVWGGDGHGAVTMGSTCINSKVARYFATGRLPRDAAVCEPAIVN